MRAFARARVTVDGGLYAVADLGHGALIGRIPVAALSVDDTRVSEAHALVSLRSGSLQLLALRRRFRVRSQEPNVEPQWCSEATLCAGTEILLADGISMHIQSVVLPDAVIGLVWDDGAMPLLHDSAAVLVRPVVDVVWRYDGVAAARLWRTGNAWRFVPERSPGPARSLELGQSIELEGVRFDIREVPLHTEGARTLGSVEPLEIVAYYDTVHILRQGREPYVIGGRGARMISELAQAKVPLPWAGLARILWRGTEDTQVLRRRLDAVLRRLRAKLSAGRVRADLVGVDGTGLIELRLDAGDRVVDRT